MPEDADLANPSTVRTLLPVVAVRDAMKDAHNRLLVLDSCRNNPADAWRQKAAVESARMAAAEIAAVALQGANTLVIFSTAPGHIALDGPAGEHSPFAAALLRQLEGTSVDLTALPASLRRDLLIATEGRQVIWDESSYTGRFVLGGPGNTPARSAPSSVDPSRIIELPNAYAFGREKKAALAFGIDRHPSAAGIATHAEDRLVSICGQVGHQCGGIGDIGRSIRHGGAVHRRT